MDSRTTIECGNSDAMLSALINELRRACEMIERLDDVTYCRAMNGSSVGAQFRHNFDFAANLLKGIETGRLDHGARERDADVETHRLYAIGRFHKLIAKLASLEGRVLGNNIVVRSEIDPSLWLPSSVGREVEFTYSHTVHHHALIAEKLAALGIDAPEHFGVAPSTVRYWAANAA
jgi:hypothetical protein